MHGIRILEIAGIGPGPFCGMLLAGMGANVLRIERPAATTDDFAIPREFALLERGRPALAVDLKHAEAAALLMQLVEKADGLFEGFRPGVMERLGFGPEVCLARNPRLVYGRITGWGQDGPLAQTAGHDGNYLALCGALSAIGAGDGPPVLPLNLVADFGGGGAWLAIGMLAALIEASRSGQGQVVDAAMLDGAATLMTMTYGMLAGGLWRDRRGSNLLDGGAPFYRPYRTLDDKYVVVCALERRFFESLLARLEIRDIDPARQFDTATWQEQQRILEAAFATRTREECCELFEGSDACVTPVLSLREAPEHPHNVARRTFVEVDGMVQPGLAPRFSRTPADRGGDRRGPGRAAVPAADAPGGPLTDWGLDAAALERLVESGVLQA